MRTGRWLLGLLPGVVFATGCSSLSQTEAGAVGGGLLGAGAGALIGSATGHTGAGAAIGAGVGALAGGVTGNAVEQSENRTKAEIQAATAAQARAQLGLVDVVTMSQQHISDSVVISQIRTTGSVYRLTPTDINWLKENGVSDPVIIEMQATASRVPPAYVRQVVRPVYVYEEPPPVGVGFSYTRYRRW